MGYFVLIVVLIFASTKTSGSEITDESVVDLKLQYLEERIHSLEQPGN